MPRAEQALQLRIGAMVDADHHISRFRMTVNRRVEGLAGPDRFLAIGIAHGAKGRGQ